MFNSINRYIESEIEPAVESTEQFLNKLRGARTRVINAINRAEQEFRTVKDERRYVASIKDDLKTTIINTAKDYLYSEFLDAIRTNNEFDEDIYRSPMVEAIENNNTYRTRFYGTGFRTRISVDINLDATAGRLEMWGSAVKRARDILGVVIPSKYSSKKKREYSAERASQAWAAIAARRRTDEKGTFYNTIGLRLSSTAKPAPYWQIIDKGTVPLSSDRGGYATKVNKETNFVAIAEENINFEASNVISRARELYETKIAEYNDALNDEKALLRRLEDMIDDVKIDIRVINNLKSNLDSVGKEVDKNKLRLAVEDVKKSLTDKRTFELGARGSRRRVSRRTIEEFIYG